ncbi:hypothetical protein [Pseudomonas sp. 273]|uniref:hypothetical protein n=1 Tax=Pseudomonas sp. 273 TaxID=75692 RepID=UPI0023D891E8|nr:hypothetical protein [Pseudomonas sp. 273]
MNIIGLNGYKLFFWGSVLAFLTGPTVALGDYPDCDEVQKTLASHPWINHEEGRRFIFSAVNNHEGMRIIDSLKRDSYKLQDRLLMDENDKDYEGFWVCRITFSYLGGDCAGDVDEFFVGSIGNAFQFSSVIRSGDRVWRGQAIADSCERGEDFSLSPQ